MHYYKKYCFTTVFTKSRDFGSQSRFRDKEPLDALGVVYEENCNCCTKIYTRETEHNLKKN